MSGRGGGRTRGTRGGRTSTRSSTSGGRTDATKATETKRTKLSDYIYYIGSAKQASDFSVITNYLILHIRKNFSPWGDDIASAIEKRRPFDFTSVKPTKDISTNPDATAKAREDEENQAFFDAEVASYVKRKDAYAANFPKAFAFLFGQCNKALQSKLQTRADYDAIIKDNPIELLKAIQEHSISYMENKYAPIIVAEALRNLIHTKQRDGEILTDYTNRFKSAKDVLKSHMGGDLYIPKLAATEPGWTPPSQTLSQAEYDTNLDCIKKAYDKTLAVVYMENADRRQYGTLITALSQQYALGQDQYPKDWIEAQRVLANHKVDAAYQEALDKKAAKAKQAKKEKASAFGAKITEAREMSFQQMELRCYKCGQVGHKSNQCKSKISDDDNKADWAINKTPELVRMQHVMSAHEDDGSTIASGLQSSSSGPLSWIHLQFHFKQAKLDMKDWILLDSCSSVDLFCNPRMVESIRPSSSKLELGTNAGVVNCRYKATLPHYGTVWYSPKAITNVLSLGNVVDKYPVTFISRQEDAFLVETDQETVKFVRLAANLYARIPHEANARQIAQVKAIVKEHTPDIHDDDELDIKRAIEKRSSKSQSSIKRAIDKRSSSHKRAIDKRSSKSKPGDDKRASKHSSSSERASKRSSSSQRASKRSSSPKRAIDKRSSSDSNSRATKADSDAGVNLVETVEDNKKLHTPNQVKRATAARDLLHALGCPSIADLKFIIKANLIKDNPITQGDVALAETIYGPDIATIKGKTTRRRNAPVVHDTVEIPKELFKAQKNVELCMDVM